MNPGAAMNLNTPAAKRRKTMSATSAASSPKRRKLKIDLALQGGGSHGALTWGVLDRLLEEEDIEIAGVSGTSAGAMNAVALACGLMQNGRTGAKAVLAEFWGKLAQSSPFAAAANAAAAWQPNTGGANLPTALPALMTPWMDNNPWLQPWQATWQGTQRWLSSHYSPYQFNPLNLNPLRDIVQSVVDFDLVRQCYKSRLFISATHVPTGELRIFEQKELTVDMVLASACLPQWFQAVEIDGEPYWDGGYAGNPSLMPLITQSPADDLLLVQINPTLRRQTPQSAQDIAERSSEITFNTSLLKELRALSMLQKAIVALGPSLENQGIAPKQRTQAQANALNPKATSARDRLVLDRVATLRLHQMEGGQALQDLGASSKMKTDAAFIQLLHLRGRTLADQWLQQHRAQLGRSSTYDLPTPW